MAGTASEEFGVGSSVEEISTGQQRSDALVEWRSSEQLEFGTPSTSPPYWDSDDEDDNGPKPCELYGKYTWKIDKFSQINKRELRSSPFEVGGYKWYILIYPQGCDVCNHLSLFLCVANHDKLLPGWSHFAQFTIAVVNKDPKKSKYSDTLHRFWKKEHDWGWKKFMELSKVLDGFIDADTLVIKAQVQVIRERADRPFRCLDCNYRRELIRVYLTNVEQICRRFVEERRGKLGKLIEDKGRWTSFCTFWLGMDQSARRAMCWEKTDSILKVITKNFFIEKEVTSTLVMDSLYSGMKALESRYSKSKGKHGDIVKPPAPIVRMEKDMFILVDDVLLLLERATLEPLPPKYEKGPQNRTKDGSSGDEFNKDSIERDERRLTELGRRTIEIFVLAHIFSKIEVAYQEAVSLKRQEELIREEEAAESEQKTRRGAADKEKKSKKKQGKQKRNNRKTKDKIKDEKLVIVPVEHHLSPNDVTEDVSDVSDSVDCIPEVVYPAADDQIPVSGNWDTVDMPDLQPLLKGSSSEICSPLANMPNGPAGEMSAVSVVDDSSSTCSTDSISSLVNGINKGKTSLYYTKQKSPNRRHERGKSTDADWSGGFYNQPSESAVGNQNDISNSCKRADMNSQVDNQTNVINQQEFKKVEEIASSRTVLGIKVEQEAERLSLEVTLTLPTQPVVPTKNSTSDRKISSSKVRSSDSKKLSDESSQVHVMSRSGISKHTAGSDSPEKKPSTQHVRVSVVKPTYTSTNQVPVLPEKPLTKTQPVPVAVVSRPLSSSSRHMVQTSQILSRSSSSSGWSNPEPSSTATSSFSYVPQSYRNVMMGNNNNNAINVSSVGFAQTPHPSSSGLQSTHPIKSSFSPFGTVKQDVMPSVRHWIETPPRTEGADDMYNHQMQHSRHNYLLSPEYAGTSGRANHGLADEFPHMGIINDLLEDDVIGKTGVTNSSFHTTFNNGGQHFHRQFSLPNETDIGPPSTSSCRFERTLSYHDGLHRYAYASPYETLPPQPSYRPYAANGHHMDTLLPNQWHMGGGGGSPYLSTRDMNNDDYTPYHHNHGEYINMASCGRINYSGFHHSSNGN